MKSPKSGKLEVLLSPADLEAKRNIGFKAETCIVFDVLRATSVIVTGLANGARGYIPVGEIADAVALHKNHPTYLLAGEREGSRITAHQSGGVDFHMGNSPREHTRERVEGRTVITTTTNGTRALQSCSDARNILAACFLNLGATSQWLRINEVENITLVCAGTGNALALEDVLAAGALCHSLCESNCKWHLSDSARVAMELSRTAKWDFASVARTSLNARRLLSMPEFCADVEFCLRLDSETVVAAMGSDGWIRPAM